MADDSEIFLKKSKEFPRERIPCEECGNDLVRCHGKVRRPYWRHINKEKCNGEKRTGESEIHKMCKELIVEYLENGGKITFYGKCENCNEKFKVGKTSKCYEYVSELSIINENGEKFIFDVAGKDKDEKVEFGIEVFHKHKTIGIPKEKRENYNWFEVKTKDILEKLNYKGKSKKLNVPKSIKLNDVREDRKCSDDCISTREIAEILGYYRTFTCERYSHPIQILLDEANRGGYIQCDGEQTKSGEWTTSSKKDIFDRKNETINYMWTMLLFREKCIRCGCKYETKRGKPFCKECWRKIKNLDEEYEGCRHERIKKERFEKIMTPTSDERKQELRKQFEFLNLVENKEEGEVTKCYKCENNKVKDEVWWWYNGQHKNICLDCVEKIWNENN